MSRSTGTKTALKRIFVDMLVICLIFIGLVSSAQALSIEACRRYAAESVRQNEENKALNAGFTGPAWSSDFDTHFNWCRQANNLATTPDHLAYRERALQESAIKSGKDAPKRYALEAVRQYQESVFMGANFPPPVWSDNFREHYNWSKRPNNLATTPIHLANREKQLQEYAIKYNKGPRMKAMVPAAPQKTVTLKTDSPSGASGLNKNLSSLVSKQEKIPGPLTPHSLTGKKPIPLKFGLVDKTTLEMMSKTYIPLNLKTSQKKSKEKRPPYPGHPAYKSKDGVIIYASSLIDWDTTQTGSVMALYNVSLKNQDIKLIKSSDSSAVPHFFIIDKMGDLGYLASAHFYKVPSGTHLYMLNVGTSLSKEELIISINNIIVPKSNIHENKSTNQFHVLVQTTAFWPELDPSPHISVSISAQSRKPSSIYNVESHHIQLIQMD